MAIIEQNNSTVRIRPERVVQSFRNPPGPIEYNTKTFSISSEYTNYSNETIFLRAQNNLVFAIEPARPSIARPLSPKLDIKTTYTLVHTEGIYKTYQMLKRLCYQNKLLSNQSNELLNRLTALYNQDGSRTNKFNFTFSVVTSVDISDIKRNRNLYVPEIDAVVSLIEESIGDECELDNYLVDENFLRPHPRSEEGMHQLSIQNDRRFKDHSGTFIYIVDNELLSSFRYYYSGKQLITVPSLQNEELDSGVYYTIGSMTRSGVVEYSSGYYTFAEAEVKLGLFLNQQDALSLGNPEIAMKNKALQYEIEIQDLKHEVERAKATNSLLISQLDIEKKERDDRYDYRSSTRKDSSELFKMVPVTLVAIAAVVTFMNRQK